MSREQNKYDADLIRLGRLYAGKNIENSKCKKFCNWIQKMKIKLLFWRK